MLRNRHAFRGSESDLMAKRRTDADRRARQCERLSRVLRVLQIIQGGSQCTAESISQELECSERTVYRDLQTLSMAGIPYYFDEECQSYRIRPGFKHLTLSVGTDEQLDLTMLKQITDQALTAAKNTMTGLEQLVSAMEQLRSALNQEEKEKD